MDPHQLSLSQAALEIREGRITSAALVRACLDRVQALEGTVHAWSFIDHDHAMKQAEAADALRGEGKPVGRLHGVPVGIKDVFDTGDMPTEFGSPIYKGRTPRRDAACVARLRAAGAVIMGKTVTAEFAYFHPGPTTNPHDSKRTPGGSSMGSAAAVAAMMVPGAIGTQTNGSTIRPAAFCGIVGFKPTHGLIPRTGALICSRTLDHVGAFARTVEDAAILAETMAGHDAGDPDTRPTAAPPLSAVAAEKPPLPPRLAFVKTPSWDKAEATTKEAFGELVGELGERAGEVELMTVFECVAEMHRVIMDVEMARNLHREYEEARDQLSPELRQLIERGRTHLAVDYRRAVDLIEKINEGVDEVFNEYDAILTPAAPGEAPIGLDSTGSPIFCSIWTYLGTPAVTLPLLKGPAGMPMGVQLVGRRGNDARLLRTARWLAEALGKSHRGAGSSPKTGKKRGKS